MYITSQTPNIQQIMRDAETTQCLGESPDLNTEASEVLCCGKHLTVVSITRSTSTVIKFIVQPKSKCSSIKRQMAVKSAFM